ncbi:peptide deformylase [Streptomyces sp. NPDC002285]
MTGPLVLIEPYAHRLGGHHQHAHGRTRRNRPPASSEDADEQYEGCLSFFDVRGMVPRRLTITVETTALDGSTVTRVYERGLARLVAHEIDHLDGLLYPSVASLYRALAEPEATAADDGLPLRPKPVRIRQPEDLLTAEEIDLRDRLQSQPHPNAEMR